MAGVDHSVDDIKGALSSALDDLYEAQRTLEEVYELMSLLLSRLGSLSKTGELRCEEESDVDNRQP